MRPATEQEQWYDELRKALAEYLTKVYGGESIDQIHPSQLRELSSLTFYAGVHWYSRAMATALGLDMEPLTEALRKLTKEILES